MSVEPPENSKTKPDAPSFDRGVSPIARRLGAQGPQRLIALSALALGCAALFAFAGSAEKPPPPKPPSDPPRQVVRFEAPPAAAANPEPEFLEETPIADQAYPDAPMGSYSGAAAQGAPASASRPPPLLVYSKAQAPVRSEPQALESRASSEATELERLSRGSQVRRLQARPIGPRNFMILAGAVIPCLLTTGIDTNAPGHVACMLPQDVLSDNGAVVLLEKGTRVLGEYRAGMSRGQRRLFVLWTRAVTPNGIAIPLASPGADALGRAGVDGEIDTRFFERFGGAAVLSLIDEGGAVVFDHRRGELARLPSEAAAQALAGASEIGPTLRKPAGAQVSIFVAHDLDFSGVYGLEKGGPAP